VLDKTAASGKSHTLFFKLGLLMNKRYTVIYVDDNPDNRILIKRFLSFEGFEVYAVATGREGLAKANEILPDLFLVDINLPDMSGQDVIKRLNQNTETRHIPKIGFSANLISQNGDSLETPDFFIQKPVDILELGAKLKSVISHRSDKQKFLL
jgi:CheY-like chemotaxis protein